MLFRSHRAPACTHHAWTVPTPRGPSWTTIKICTGLRPPARPHWAVLRPRIPHALGPRATSPTGPCTVGLGHVSCGPVLTCKPHHPAGLTCYMFGPLQHRGFSCELLRLEFFSGGSNSRHQILTKVYLRIYIFLNNYFLDNI